MAASIRQRIRDEMLRAMREDVQFSVCDGDDCGPIRTENVIFARFKSGGKAEQTVDQDDWIEKPGLVLVAPRIGLPPTEGTNDEDDWHYSFMWQIVDKQGNDPKANVNTYWRWQEQIASYFNMSQLNQQIDDERGAVYVVAAYTVEDVDEKSWPVTRDFVAGVVCDIICRQPRGVV